MPSGRVNGSPDLTWGRANPLTGRPMLPPPPDHDPCMDCGCCALWSQALELLRATLHIHRASNCPIEHCIVCRELAR